MADPPDDRPRCSWATGDPLLIQYHDTEWGVPTHDDRELFERLILEGFQAGLSWLTILRKREGFRRAFAGWDPQRVAAFGPAEVAGLLVNPEIIRHRQKIAAAVGNARAFLEVQREAGSFDRYVWSFAGGAPRQRPAPASLADIPSQTPESARLSADLRRRGFAFVGPTICYAFMQSVGMVDDHTVDCFLAARPARP